MFTFVPANNYPDMRIEQNYSLLKHNTFGLDVKTKYFVEYETETDLQKLLRDEFFFSQCFWHIGQGSNLLFLGDFDGIILHSAIQGIEKIKEDEHSVWLKAGAGNDWDSFVAYCVEKGWSGLENLSLIPGEVGASAVQNIGAYGAEVSERIEEVHAYSLETGEKRIFSNAECNYSYRHSFFKEPKNKGKNYIVHVVFKLSKQPEFRLDYGNLREYLAKKKVSLQNIREAVIAIRQSKLPDPKETGNAGSFFMNPYINKEYFERLKKDYPDIPYYPVDDERVKIPAAWLIEQCGLKGKTVGGAAVHEKHALVIINQNHATGKDIAMLAKEIGKKVKEKFDVELQPEVNYI
jgi:UDP-N-acetylmuramate dehydrogenase